MNKVILVGTLERTPRLQFSADGTPYCLFTLVCERPICKNGDLRAPFRLPCRVRGERARTLARRCVSGQQIVCEGYLTEKHRHLGITVNHIDLGTNPHQGEALWFTDDLPF